MARRRIPDGEGLEAVRAVEASVQGAQGGTGAGGPAVDRATFGVAVRYTLQALAEAAPGNNVEVRVPPFGAVQCVEGPRHTRGTPPNVIEVDPDAWFALATGRLGWGEAIDRGLVQASGSRADLRDLLPLELGDESATDARQ